MHIKTFTEIAKISSSVFLALLLGTTVAQAKDPVTVTTSVSGPGGALAVEQSTDFGDLGTGCIVGGKKPCPGSHNYSNGPKNMRFMLCLKDAGNVTFTQACLNIMNNPGSCKRNTISTALCGTLGIAYGGGSIYAVNEYPACEYRTSSGSASWNWTVTEASGGYTVDCTMTGMQIHN